MQTNCTDVSMLQCDTHCYAGYSSCAPTGKHACMHEMLAAGCAGTPARASLEAMGAAGAGPEAAVVAAVEAEAVAGMAAEAAQTCDAAASISPCLSSHGKCAWHASACWGRGAPAPQRSLPLRDSPRASCCSFWRSCIS